MIKFKEKNITTITGPMFSGKSDALLDYYIKIKKYSKREVISFKSIKDTRQKTIQSRNHKEEIMPNHEISSLGELVKIIKRKIDRINKEILLLESIKLTKNNYNQIVEIQNKIFEKEKEKRFVVLVDEAQFLTDEENIYSELKNLSYEGPQFVFSCLNTNFKSEPFPVSGKLLAISNNPIWCEAICMDCMNASAENSVLLEEKILDSGDYLVGDTETYKVICDECKAKMNRQRANAQKYQKAIA